ncbi:pali-domain-containing protein [Dothidotthia symphoricarpi CBS 119687]|uniref:Pali-domain-containing protein n=1 Tax=Dothidotthia symphoricarpi CBS 119687 TaxID=1392245 RepID=A0A6A6AJS6_9PLEO|nr:pali-domain-containing protein [Dothidotthia symphoricarpi CBS 119687]KAF2132232.1 pali-domain-containing protein [Dothidotthia symphoricarpi CBS 119687]
MMLRPATPLSILFFVAFCLLLLSTLSTPIIKGIPIATYRGINFGVLGYCENDSCTGPTIGYDTETLFADNPDTDFSLPAATRHALSSILIVHPVAALMTLICFGLAVAAHFHSPAHSPRYLLALLIFTFPTLLVSLLAFLVDILLFVPHVAWGGWIVLAATILIVASWIVTCAMRRTLVSRKARKRRIAEHDGMNGQDYYTNRANTTNVATDFPKAESPPPFAGDHAMSGSSTNDYASFELQKQSSPQSHEDMTPLNQRNPSLKTNSSNGRDGSDVLGPTRGPLGRGRQPVDQYGNTIPPMPNDTYMMQAPPRGGGRGGMYRGRGGPPPRGGPNGGPRGGYGPGPGPRGGMRGPPPPGWNGNGRGMRPGPGGPGGPMPGGPGPMGRGAPPPGYNNNFYGQGPPPPRDVSPYDARGTSPGPMQPHAAIGQAIEMDARNGTPPANQQTFGLRESDGDVQGMLALQQGGFPAHSPQRRLSELASPTSSYSQEEQQQSQQYAPPRSNWDPTQNNTSDPTLMSSSGNHSGGLSPIQDSPIELPNQQSHTGVPLPHISERTSDYYEDVDPKFAEPARNNPQPRVPSLLVPGNYQSQNQQHGFLSAPRHSNHSPHNNSDPNLPRSSSYDDLPEASGSGSRSPAVSEASHYTSVSQRPVNPAWRPDMGGPPGQFGPYGGGGGGRGRPMRQEDVIFSANAANPDFAIPGMGRGRGRGRGRGGRGGGMNQAPPANTMGPGAALGTQGRYPGASAM